ncbi:MAG: NHL repeat-containing protein [Sandaracinaceae bacterium]
MTELARVALAGPPTGDPGRPLLCPTGPAVVLGGADPFAGAVSPSPTSLFGPRGACLGGDGSLWIADTGHHRLLGYRERPLSDGRPADWVLGQPDMRSEGRNALGPASSRTLNVPTGVARWGDRGLAVADAWNNRVLVWREAPRASDTPADLVLGQASFDAQEPNRGRATAGADTMHWPFQVKVVDDRVYVADGGNRRVLVWHGLPSESGQPADGVLGQPSLDERSDNGGAGVGPGTFRWPHDLAVLDGRLLVTDAGNNRVLVWDGFPDGGMPSATVVLGQSDFASVDHNQGAYWPGPSSVNMPYALDAAAGWVLVADTANSRLVGFRAPLADGQAAVALTGQPHFGAKGDNRWGPPVRDSLCWPYGLALAEDRTAVVADTGNHRVLLWPLAEGIG